MGMILRLATPTSDQRAKVNGTPYTWEDYAKQCVDIVLSRHQFAKTLVCVNDPYKHPHSIKDEERELRTKNSGHVANVFMKKHDVFPNANDFKTLMLS